MKIIPPTDRYDPNFRRVKYVQYADDFLIGLIAPKNYAVALKQKLKEYLQNVLSLRLSDEKTKLMLLKMMWSFLDISSAKDASYTLLAKECK